MQVTTYREADSLVIAALNKWRKKTPPYSQDETVTCPACSGRMRFQQAVFNDLGARTRVSARCGTPFCVNYTE